MKVFSSHKHKPLAKVIYNASKDKNYILIG